MKYILFILIAIILVGCKVDSPQPSSGKEEVNHAMTIDNNGETVNRLKSVMLSDARFQVLYKPLAVAIASGERVEITTKNIARFQNDYDGYLYFDLRIGLKDMKGDIIKYLSESPEEYEEMLKYCAFNISRDISIVIDEQDTLPCSSSLFERTYGIIPDLTFMTVFSKPSKPFTKLAFILNDRIFNNGPIKFVFDKSELEEPQIP